jgi:hypothetical protein
VRAARGTWVQMLHADDLMDRETLVGRLAAIRTRSADAAVMVAGRHRQFQSVPDSSSNLHPRWSWPSLLDGGALTRTVLPFHCPFVPFTLFRRSAFLAIGGFDPRWELVQDWDLWMRLLQTGDLLYHPHNSGYWRIHPLSSTYMAQFASEHEAFTDRLTTRVSGIKPRAVHRAYRVNSSRAALLRCSGPPTKSDRRLVRAARRRTALRMHIMRSLGTVHVPRLVAREGGTTRAGSRRAERAE